MINSGAKVCVIGSGTMGSGIAAQVANAGGTVLLLDLPCEGDNRNAITEAALERIEKSDPPLLMKPENIELITPGNIDDDLEKVRQCEWVVEAIVERLDVKRNLYKALEPYLSDEAILSSNTSTIPISLLTEQMPEKLRKRFCITHFFNPVRYMRLLELVRGKDTDDATIDTMAIYCDQILGKGVVQCADTPGFLGNRVGVFAMQAAIFEAMELGLDIEDVDAIFGRPMGFPKTGAFGLYDLIGVDLMADVVRSLRSILPQGDPFHEIGAENDLVNAQIENGFTGLKGKGGFYAEIDGKDVTLDLKTGKWRDRKTETPELVQKTETAGLENGLDLLIEGDDTLSVFAWRVLARVLTYSASLIPEVTQSPQDIDDAMKLGYNWVKGPFEMIDAIGGEVFIKRLEAEKRPIPDFLRDSEGAPFYKVENGQLRIRHADGQYHPLNLPDGVVRFNLMRRTLTPIAQNASASLFKLANDIHLVEFHTKANALDELSMEIVAKAAAKPGRGIIIHNDAAHFSAGVNLVRFLEMIDAKDWDGIDRFLIGFQEAVAALKYCKRPVIGAPSGLALGGGYEVLAHCSHIFAHANTVFGLVEASVGLVPGGGGVKETYWRWYKKTNDWQKAAWKTFNQIGYGLTATSPELAAKYTYFLPRWESKERDKQLMNRDWLVNECTKALMLDKDLQSYQPPKEPVFKLAGKQTYNEMIEFLHEGEKEGKFMPHDVTVASQIAWIVTGGENGGDENADFSEADLYARERKAFINLAKQEKTRQRIVSMLAGKLIRN